MESKRLVKRTRVPGNRRIDHVSLTRAGERLIDEVEPVYRREIHRIMNGLRSSECHTLIRSLERLRTEITDATMEKEAG